MAETATEISVEELAAWLAEQTWSAFAQSLASFHAKKGYLSEKQEAAARSMHAKCIAKAEAKAAEKAAVATVADDLDAGLYGNDDAQVIKVYRTRGSKQLVGKVLTLIHEGHWEFVYGGKKALVGLTADHKLSAEAAAKFGGATGQCVNCLAELTDERSIHVGYGPVCAKNHGWPYPTKVSLLGLEDPGEPVFPGAEILVGSAATGYV